MLLVGILIVCSSMLPAHCPLIISSSTTGPKARAGRNVRAPTMTTTPIKRITNNGVWVGKVPRPAGTGFCEPGPPRVPESE